MVAAPIISLPSSSLNTVVMAPIAESFQTVASILHLVQSSGGGSQVITLPSIIVIGGSVFLFSSASEFSVQDCLKYRLDQNFFLDLI
ncbi:hypothetical protein Ahy_A05g022243 isoform C [Arachis hypogaea]|uniref:Uncharacterized protein n=1 Tax=Arachis hypogaea TaxID=3818 RepID=A0A445D0F3_ARAHY|nr:hypothetical protein Ahy_A05g022243 isoform C [Arachis hypogaea]